MAPADKSSGCHPAKKAHLIIGARHVGKPLVPDGSPNSWTSASSRKTVGSNSNARCKHQNDANASDQDGQCRPVVFEPSPILTELIHSGKSLLPAIFFPGPKWLGGPGGIASPFSSARPDFALIRLHIEFSDNGRLVVVLPIGVVVVLVSSGSHGSSCRQSGDKAHPSVEALGCALSCCLGLLLLAHPKCVAFLVIACSSGYDKQRMAMCPNGERARELTRNSQPSYGAGLEVGALGTLVSGGFFVAGTSRSLFRAIPVERSPPDPVVAIDISSPKMMMENRAA